MSVTVRWKAEALRQFGIAAAQKDLRVRSNRVLNAARRGAPVDTGRLRSSLSVQYLFVDGAPAARVGTNVTYARFVHDGTGLYGPKHAVIRPRNGRVMVWATVNNSYRSTGGPRRYKSGSTRSYTAATFVRGQRPQPFLRDALAAAGR